MEIEFWRTVCFGVIFMTGKRIPAASKPALNLAEKLGGIP